MVDYRETSGQEQYNPIEPIELSFSKDIIKKEALKVLTAEGAVMKAASIARNIGNASASLEPEIKAVAGGMVFIAKDVGNLLADLLILVSRAIETGHQASSENTSTKPQPGS
jgi:hypothetical protein